MIRNVCSQIARSGGPEPIKNRRIMAVMDAMPGWEKAPYPIRIPGYGSQRGWTRKNDYKATTERQQVAVDATTVTTGRLQAPVDIEEL